MIMILLWLLLLLLLSFPAAAVAFFLVLTMTLIYWSLNVFTYVGPVPGWADAAALGPAGRRPHPVCSPHCAAARGPGRLCWLPRAANLRYVGGTLFGQVDTKYHVFVKENKFKTVKYYWEFGHNISRVYLTKISVKPATRKERATSFEIIGPHMYKKDSDIDTMSRAVWSKWGKHK